jgi:hypothetical protein
MLSSNFHLPMRSAIAVHNMGISLMERHCYTLAGETFNDAFTILRSLTSTSDELSIEECSMRHQCALERMVTGVAPQQQKAMINNKVMELRSISCIDLSTTNLSECMSGSNHIICLIRLDDVEITDERIETLLSVVLLNLSIAYLSMSKNTKSEHATAAKYKTSAIKLTQLSHALCSKVLSESTDRNGLNYLENIQIMAIILNILVIVLQDSGEYNEALAYETKLICVRDAFRHMERTSNALLTSCCKNAAAA